MAENAIYALIVAGGRGSRARLGAPKQYAPLAGVPMLRHTVAAFTDHPQVAGVLVVIGEDDKALYTEATEGLTNLLPPATGGATRQASVKAGLDALATAPPAPAAVLIHDGARPFVSAQTISDVIAQLSTAEGAIAAHPLADTLKRSHEGGGIAETVPREGLWRASTPQGFRFETIMTAHRAARDGDVVTDDASLLEARGVHVALVPDEPRNVKLTYKEDFALAEQLLSANRETRTGFGVDVHAFIEGESVILGGVEIPHTHKLAGHSDADVLMHTISDALYGALAEGDIGAHFPPSDEQWRGAASKIFLEHAVSRVRERGGRIVHIDATLACEAPKIGPHREAIRESLSAIMGLPAERISIKATTTEKLGFTGRGEGIACQAVATVELPAT